MELNWTTVVLEIVNFLVLVWILKHFLYRPVLRVVEQRRAAIEATVSEARQREQAAEELRTQFEKRLADWQQDKQEAHDELQREIRHQRSRAMDELRQTLGAEREKASVVDQRQQREREEARQRAALELGARFASKLLRNLSGPQLEARIVELVCTELAELPDKRQSALRRAVSDDADAIRVHSAFTLEDAQRQQLSQALQTVLGTEIKLFFTQEPELIAGLRLSVGDWALAANLRDELKGFTDLVHDVG